MAREFKNWVATQWLLVDDDGDMRAIIDATEEGFEARVYDSDGNESPTMHYDLATCEHRPKLEDVQAAVAGAVKELMEKEAAG